MSSKYNNKFQGVLYSEDFPLEFDAMPIAKNYSEEEDSYVRILESRTIVHPCLEDEYEENGRSIRDRTLDFD